MSSLDHAYHRIPHLALARATYAVIDASHSVDVSRDNIHPVRLDREIYEIAAILNVLQNEEQWETALDYFEDGFDEVSTPFLGDIAYLLGNLDSSDSVIRQTSSYLLSYGKEDVSGDTLKLMLENGDSEVMNRATAHIILYKRFDLFGEMLRSQPKALRESYYSDFTYEDLEQLFAQKDRAVDAFCYKVVSESLDMELLPLVVKRLNESDSSLGRSAVQDVLNGPNPLDGIGDAWERIEALHLPLKELKEYIEVGTAPKQRDPRKWKFLNAVKGLGNQAGQEDWGFLQSIYLREVTRGVNQTYGAVMAKALMIVDEKRTREFLVAELTESDEHKRQSAALAGMGLVADKYFESTIVQFRDNLPTGSPKNQYPASYIFQNSYYARFLDYAYHRCKGIHRWQLQLNTEQQYYLESNPASP
ncbi:MAG: hypothetical protein ACSHYA_11680 [Opitutaceae bacterium]